MTRLDKFNISTVSRKLNGINTKISIANDIPFPCFVLLSNYRFKKKHVKILPNGDIQGGFTKMITSLIDFSFVRSMCAPCYSIKSPPAYDPVSLFLLELFRYIDQYKNCTWFSDKCSCIAVNNVINRVKKQIMYRLNNPNKINLDKAFRIKCECPYVPEGKIMKKTPKDTDARIGVRRDPQNANRKQKIFGYNLVLSTSVELDLKLELPVAATNISGNGEEGKKIITNTEQIKAHHGSVTKIDIADAKYDIIKNNPRLINEIPRGTKRFKMLQRCRSASERVNSVIKEDLT